MRIAVLHARVRVEEKMLLAELERRGVEIELVDVESEVFALEPGALGAAGSRDWSRVDAVIDRCLSHSRALAAVRVLEAFGVPCVNRRAVTELCGDKVATNLALLAAGVPVPRARVATSTEAALAALEELGYPAVLKPPVGSWGRLLARLNDRHAAEAVLEHKATLGGPGHNVLYLQEYVEKGGRDVRSFVVGGETLCAIERRSQHWITNTARGAKVVARRIDDELDAVSRAAARAVGGGIVAIDIFETPRGLLVNEVNATMEFRNSVEPTGVDLPAAIVDHVLEVAEAGRRASPPPARVAASARPADGGARESTPLPVAAR